KYQLINNKGQLLPIKLPYDGVSPFSNGMAVVREGHKYGAIDITGKLRIPLEYHSIHPFQKNLAAAQHANKPREVLLIDRNNKVIKRFAGYQRLSAKTNSNDARYQVYDQSQGFYTVDADGNRVNSEKQE
ncbi:MAG: WG repeat-containing protein, partial [Limnobaculum xujianqingii]